VFDGLIPILQAPAESFFRWCEYSGLEPHITSVRRTREQQEALYARFQAGLSGGLPAAPPGMSLHEYGLAFDMVTNNPKYAGATWNRMGGFWSAKDWVHFEFRPKGMVFKYGSLYAMSTATPFLRQVWQEVIATTN